MNQDFNLNIPKSLRGVKLQDWVKFIDVYDKNKDNESNDFLNKKMLEIFCGTRVKITYIEYQYLALITIIEHLYLIP